MPLGVSVIVRGPAGQRLCKSPSEVRAQLARQRDKRNAAMKAGKDAVLETLLKEGQDLVLKRTGDRLDWERRDFGDYAPRYARQKGVSPSDVTLKLSGDMLESLKREVIRTGERGRLYLSGAQQEKKAVGLGQGTWPVFGKKIRGFQRPKRRFMGFGTQEDRDTLFHKALRTWQRVLRRELMRG